MDYSLKPQPVIAQVLPGMAALAVLLYIYFPAVYPNAQFEGGFVSLRGGAQAVLAIGFFFAAWILGTLFDAIRHAFVEGPKELVNLLCRRCASQPGWWDIFFKGERTQVDQLHEFYYAYYSLDGNFLVAIIFILAAWALHPWPRVALAFLVIVALGAFLLDRCVLGNEMQRLSKDYLARLDAAERSGRAALLEQKSLPHEGVYTRLKGSETHGVGVFAICDIKKDAALFEGDVTPAIWIDAAKTRGLPAQIQQLYHDFCILKDGEYYCPTSFNALTVGWYINHAAPPAKPNVRVEISEAGGRPDYEFFALRDIRAGEELLVDYGTYCSPEQVPSADAGAAV